jgi:hypothetical protein
MSGYFSQFTRNDQLYDTVASILNDTSNKKSLNYIEEHLKLSVIKDIEVYENNGKYTIYSNVGFPKDKINIFKRLNPKLINNNIVELTESQIDQLFGITESKKKRKKNEEDDEEDFDKDKIEFNPKLEEEDLNNFDLTDNDADPKTVLEPEKIKELINKTFDDNIEDLNTKIDNGVLKISFKATPKNGMTLSDMKKYYQETGINAVVSVGKEPDTFMINVDNMIIPESFSVKLKQKFIKRS